MPIKNFIGGSIPDADADDLNRYLIQSHHVIKPSDQSISNSTTYQNDSHLAVQVSANTDYWVICQIIYTGGTGGDLKLGYLGPSGATFSWLTDALGSGASGNADAISRSKQIISSSPVAGTVGGTSDSICINKGVLRVGSNSGTFRFRWAQGTSNATATIVRGGSMLMIRRLTT